MDEPFSAVDTLTRIGLEGLVRALWQELAPATVALDVPIDLPSPRNQITTRALSEYLDYRARLLAQVFARDEVANIGAP
jgi:NitT/TauT family transport system ATP-binding protein